MPISQNPADPTGMPQASATLLPLLTAEDCPSRGHGGARVVPVLRVEVAPRRPSADEGGAGRAGRRGRDPRGRRVLRRPRGHDGPHLRAHDERRGGGRAALPGRRLGRFALVLPLPLRARRRRGPEPGADGRGPQRRRHAPGLRHRRAAERPPRLHGRGRGQVPRDHAEALSARADPGHHEPGARARRGAGLRPELRDRPRQRDPLVPDHRLHRPAAQGRHCRRERGDHRPRQPRRGEGPGTRPPDRCPARRVRPGRADADLRHAR